jgi:hypothetical protein
MVSDAVVFNEIHSSGCRKYISRVKKKSKTVGFICGVKQAHREKYPIRLIF